VPKCSECEHEIRDVRNLKHCRECGTVLCYRCSVRVEEGEFMCLDCCSQKGIKVLDEKYGSKGRFSACRRAVTEFPEEDPSEEDRMIRKF